MVVDLVNHVDRSWDVELIRCFFTESCAKEILRMPVPKSDLEDKWIWAFEKIEVYLVMSFLLRIQNQRVSNMIVEKETWEKLWKCKIQDWLKLMLWKVGADAFKTRGGLGRILHCEDSKEFLCPLCRNGVEDTIHLIAFCDVASQAWRG